MSMYLVDDGTMDTVIACSTCGTTRRYCWDLDNDTTETYEDFVDWAITDMTDLHECPVMDIRKVLYVFGMDYHSGQFSRGYRLQCAAGRALARRNEPEGPDSWINQPRVVRNIRASEKYKLLRDHYVGKM